MMALTACWLKPLYPSRLEVFKVAADRAVAEKLLMLLGRDPASNQGPVSPVPRTGQRSPAVKACRRNGKFENGAIVSMPASLFKAVAQGIEVELSFQMVHSRLEDRLAMKRDPQADSARPRKVGQRHTSKIFGRFCGSQVEVGEDHDARDGMLEHLGPHPACSPA